MSPKDLIGLGCKGSFNTVLFFPLCFSCTEHMHAFRSLLDKSLSLQHSQPLCFLHPVMLKVIKKTQTLKPASLSIHLISVHPTLLIESKVQFWAIQWKTLGLCFSCLTCPAREITSKRCQRSDYEQHTEFPPTKGICFLSCSELQYLDGSSGV